MKKLLLTALVTFLAAVPGISAEEISAINLQTYLVKVDNDALGYENSGFETLENITILKLASFLPDPNQAQIIATAEFSMIDVPITHSFFDRSNVSIEKKVTGRDFEPYELTDYQWVENSVDIKIEEAQIENDLIYLNFLYSAKHGEKVETKKTGNVINEVRMNFAQHLILQDNKSKIINITSSKDVTCILIAKAVIENEK